MCVSVISHSTPLTIEPFALSHKMSVVSLGKIADVGMYPNALPFFPNNQ